MGYIAIEAFIRLVNLMSYVSTCPSFLTERQTHRQPIEILIDEGSLEVWRSRHTNVYCLA